MQKESEVKVMGEPVKTTVDDMIILIEACCKYNADIGQVVTLFELIGGLSEEKARHVLYQASIAAAAEKVLPLMPA